MSTLLRSELCNEKKNIIRSSRFISREIMTKKEPPKMESSFDIIYLILNIKKSDI